MTCLKRYGVENPNQNKQVRLKTRKTCLEKFGVEYSCQAPTVKEKSKQTCMEKYGVQHPAQVKAVMETCKRTILKRYGVEHALQNHDVFRKSKKKYRYLNITFDSSPELALYIYLADHNVDFEYQPKTEFWYESADKKHKFMPDFRIGNHFVEIKGDHLVNKATGAWQNPWNHAKDACVEAKHQCCLDNNIQIIYTDEYQKYLDYVAKKYGKDYLKLAKNI